MQRGGATWGGSMVLVVESGSIVAGPVRARHAGVILAPLDGIASCGKGNTMPDTKPSGADDAVAVVEVFGTAWADHDLDRTLAMVTEDCVFDATGPAPDGTRCVGKDTIRDAWRPNFDDRASNFVAEETFGAGDRVIQLWRYEWGDGHIRGVDVFRVRDGLVAEKFSYVKG